MTALVTTDTRAFEGCELTTYVVDGRPCWLAADVAAVIGYSRRSTIANLVRRDWAAEFVEGEDFDVVTGPLLDAIRQAPASSGSTRQGIPASSALTRAKHAVVLYEQGVHGVCLLTRKPKGVAFRRWLRSEVLPSLARTGRYEVEPPVALAPAVEPEPEPEFATLDEVRLWWVERAIKALTGRLDPTVIADWHAMALQLRGVAVCGFANGQRPGVAAKLRAPEPFALPAGDPEVIVKQLDALDQAIRAAGDTAPAQLLGDWYGAAMGLLGLPEWRLIVGGKPPVLPTQPRKLPALEGGER